jgi:hypothetical protein
MVTPPFIKSRGKKPVSGLGLGGAWLEDKFTAMEQGAYHEALERGAYLRL